MTLIAAPARVTPPTDDQDLLIEFKQVEKTFSNGYRPFLPSTCR